MKKNNANDVMNARRQDARLRRQRRDAQLRTYLQSDRSRRILRDRFPKPLVVNEPDPLVAVFHRIRGDHRGHRANLVRLAQLVEHAR